VVCFGIWRPVSFWYSFPAGEDGPKMELVAAASLTPNMWPSISLWL